MVHLDLFSGIGGFAYAADQVWDDVEHIFCDNDKFCQQVLKKHWPGSVIYDDIRAITSPEFIENARCRDKAQSRHSNEKHTRGNGKERPASKISRPDSFGLDLLTGGFPCQPFSAAGVRRGTSDDRYLWPEMLRVIQLTQPTWVIAENVRGLLTWEQGVVFEQICTDLEAAGYEVQPLIIPAVAVNAPHRRDRIWWVARNTKSAGEAEVSRTKDRESTYTKRTNGDTTDSERQRWNKRFGQKTNQRKESGQEWTRVRNNVGADSDTNWNQDWLEVATELCSLDDGLPAELDGFKLSKPQHRKEQLKAYGNAIVPQVAIEIMKGIKVGEQVEQ